MAHLRIQRRDVRRGDVGRVGDHQVEACRLQARGPVPAQQGRPRSEAEVGGVLAGHRQGFLRDIDAQASGGRPFGQQRQENGSGAHAQVQDPRGDGRVQPLEGGDHHQLGVRTRGEHLRADAQQHGPEALAAEDMGDGFAPFATLQIGVERLRLLLGQRPVRVVQQVGPGGARGGLQQQPRVDHRRVDAGGLEAITGGGPGLDEGGHAADADGGAMAC